MFIAENHMTGYVFQASFRELIIRLEEGGELEDFTAVKEVRLESAQ